MIPAQPAQFQSASLYVGDLLNDITEGMLFEIFNRVGPVASIRVCRDAVTRRSLGYAYVNFHHVQDAERALDTMNFTDIKGNPCRIMWSQRDPTLRKTGVGNIFVKNLATTIDNKGLFDTFSVFGNILSCKVVNDDAGASKGYGYVHYETGEAAEEAIAKLNGITMDDQAVTVGFFLRRQDRAGENDWTNLYLKQFPLHWDDEKLTAVFGEYGAIASVFVSRDEAGKSKGFGFIDYKEHEPAAKALAELAGKAFEDEAGNPVELYVNRAQKKSERVRENRSRVDAMKLERINKYQGMNLYVKNLDDTVDEDAFRATFAPFGTITSARIMRGDDGVSRGFGFICFSNPEEATRAVAEMNGKMVRAKPIVVTLHQRKEHRMAHLQATFGSRGAGMPRGFPGMGQSPMPYMGMYMQNGQQPMPPRQMNGQQYQMMPGGMMPRGGPRGPMPNFQGGRGYPNPQYGMQQGGPGFKGGRGPMQGQGMQGGRRPQQGGRGPQGQGMQQMQGGRGMQQGQGQRMNNQGNQGVKYTAQARNQPGPNGQMMQGQQAAPAAQSAPSGNQDNLDHIALAQADSNAQKNMIGEQLYPMIQAHQPELAGKITGMLLEMDNAELLHLMDTPDALASKVEEAIAVLRAHAPTN
jgi:polyadenylate-binding protein